MMVIFLITVAAGEHWAFLFHPKTGYDPPYLVPTIIMTFAAIAFLLALMSHPTKEKKANENPSK